MSHSTFRSVRVSCEQSWAIALASRNPCRTAVDKKWTKRFHYKTMNEVDVCKNVDTPAGKGEAIVKLWRANACWSLDDWWWMRYKFLPTYSAGLTYLRVTDALKRICSYQTLTSDKPNGSRRAERSYMHTQMSAVNGELKYREIELKSFSQPEYYIPPL